MILLFVNGSEVSWCGIVNGPHKQTHGDLSTFVHKLKVIASKLPRKQTKFAYTYSI